ncbi:MAG: fatty acid desaturase [Planctomycetaceae bacterium]|nr:fatty acid desaturase [Planctomycetaceae bacterium]
MSKILRNCENSTRLTRRKTMLRFLLMLGMHLGALSAPFCFDWSVIPVTAMLFLISGIGISVGYHRLLTHRAFKTTPLLEKIFATMGAVAFQGGPLEWVALHRIHHKFSDTHEDPHTPAKGFWYGYITWLLDCDDRVQDPAQRDRYIPDLIAVSYYQFLDRHPYSVEIFLAAALFLVGESMAPGLGGAWLVYGIFVRFVLMQHVTWMVNAVTHRFGYQNFETRDNSQNCWWLALLSFGEGWHNNHHAKPTSANFGSRLLELDFGFWVIKGLEKLKLIWEVKNGFSDKDDTARTRASTPV